MKTLQINIKISEKDLIQVDEKAKRYGLSRSAMIKLFALNAEMDVKMLGELQKPIV